LTEVKKLNITANSKTNKDIALQFLTHAFSFQFDDALSLIANNASWWVAGSPEKLAVAGEKNRRQIKKLLRGLGSAVPEGLDMKIIGVTAEGPRVAVEVEAQGQAITGRQYHNHYHFLIEIENCLIVRVKEYMDTLHLYEIF
jgi:ketosteroid isomerase-like protein